jgi:hypothetical protein
MISRSQNFEEAFHKCIEATFAAEVVIFAFTISLYPSLLTSPIATSKIEPG